MDNFDLYLLEGLISLHGYLKKEQKLKLVCKILPQKLAQCYNSKKVKCLALTFCYVIVLWFTRI